MKQKISIILFEQYEHLNVYSIVIDDNKKCEMEKFLDYMQMEKRTKDLTLILNLITKIGQNGAQERYFRYEGKRNDHVCAIPGHYLIKSDCRLYCLRYGESILVLGNGGIKQTKTYQEDSHLSDCVATLQEIDDAIQKMVGSGDIQLSGKTILGKVDFFI